MFCLFESLFFSSVLLFLGFVVFLFVCFCLFVCSFVRFLLVSFVCERVCEFVCFMCFSLLMWFVQLLGLCFLLPCVLVLV